MKKIILILEFIGVCTLYKEVYEAKTARNYQPNEPKVPAKW